MRLLPLTCLSSNYYAFKDAYGIIPVTTSDKDFPNPQLCRFVIVAADNGNIWWHAQYIYNPHPTMSHLPIIHVTKPNPSCSPSYTNPLNYMSFNNMKKWLAYGRTIRWISFGIRSGVLTKSKSWVKVRVNSAT